MGDPYPLTPVEVQPIRTANRVIQTPIPHPSTVPMLEKMRSLEPWCMEGQPPIIWDRAEGASVFDSFGNKWIDFTSGVLITNAGHGRKEMIDAVVKTAQHGLLTTYCFPTQQRFKLVEALQKVAPRRDDKIMLLSTGSEAIELCIKLAREHARRKNKTNPVFVTFANAFHGRTLGSQRAGGIPSLKEWIGYADEHFVNVPFPDSLRTKPEDNDFSAFEKALTRQGVKPEQVCGVLTETYQGGGSSFGPPEYFQKLRQWCDKHGALMCMDEVQAGFGRTGKFWGFEHYGIIPDLIACGKGVSGALPLSAVIGRKEILDMFPPGSMTSTHSGNPICAASALASLELIHKEKLVERSAKLGAVLHETCAKIKQRFGDVILASHGKGLVASLHCVKPGTTEADGTFAWKVVGRAVQTGVMLFAPVGFAGACVKISPPLMIAEDALREGLSVVEAAFEYVLETQTVAK
ncbi:MAG: aspartate aminotransferase family protein [Phycisphaeraceae bacterium]|nr:aspartate aminotransferase family protein [Phycisphaeraceae bacterium]